jgi:hypothetical protein
MPRSPKVVAREKVDKRKSQLRTLLNQVDDCRAKGRQELLDALDAGASKTELALRWGTSYGHLSAILAQAREERG